ncbi:MAG TPA: DUF2911 domain-containing protein [Pyrinomonadaceae bacterium]|jgi:hypothetical protein
MNKMNKLFLLVILVFVFSIGTFAQAPVLPRESQRAAISQLIGDTTVSIVYHRPNTKGRKIWGELVPFGQVWRTGANEATIFEVSNDVTINGQLLPKGKYSLHTIPNESEWTLIFNKTWNQWGSFEYDAKQDALRVTAKPLPGEMRDTMSVDFGDMKPNSTQIVIAWEKLRVPFTVDVGDFNKRVVNDFRSKIVGDPVQAANYILNTKITTSYEEALGWLNNSIAMRETFGNLSTKARLLNEMGKTNEAVLTAEKAIQIGKAATPAANTTNLENLLKEWRAKK